VRRFDANEILAFAQLFQLPVSHFFLPPDEAEYADAHFLVDVPGEVGITLIRRFQLMRRVMDPEPSPEFSQRVQVELAKHGEVWKPMPTDHYLPPDSEALKTALREVLQETSDPMRWPESTRGEAEQDE